MAGCNSTLGNSKSDSYVFGASELRVGSLSNVLKLSQDHSVGVLQDVTINYSREFAELRGGRNNPVLSRSVSQSDLSVSATMNEATYRNLSLMLGNGDNTVTEDVTTTEATGASAAATTLTLAADFNSDPVAGDLLVVYSAIDPAQIQVVRVASFATPAVTLHADTPLMFDVAVGDVIEKVNPIGIGASCGESYLTAQILLDSTSTNTPKQFLGWYGSITSSLEYSQSTTDYGTMSLEMSFYPVPASLVGAGADMEHAATEIAKYPLGFITP